MTSAGGSLPGFGPVSDLAQPSAQSHSGKAVPVESKVGHELGIESPRKSKSGTLASLRVAVGQA
eukprot:1290449-Alexandrium_andersonii.AAC.1